MKYPKIIVMFCLAINFSAPILAQEIELNGKVVIPTIETENDDGELLIRTSDGSVKQRMINSLPPSECERPWILAGELADLDNTTAEISTYSLAEYEYGISFTAVSPEIIPIVITYWFTGLRVYSRQQFLVGSNDPTKDQRYGGVMFYRNTGASDDDACTIGTWRHKYWYINHSTSEVATFASNGCLSPPVYVRKR